MNDLPDYHAAAAFTTKSSEVFKEAEEISPRHVSDKVSYMPWGADNELHTTADPKFERKIPALIANFCTYYAPHANHSVIYYYDATALGSNYAVNDQDFHWVIVHEFERHGWSVQDVYLGNPMRHDEKYLLINQVFFRQATLDALFQPPNVVQMRTKSNLFKLCRVQPTFVKQNNDDLILAMQSAGVERGRNDFRKNKSTEKNPESEEDLLEHHTYGTDAFDTL